MQNKLNSKIILNLLKITTRIKPFKKIIKFSFIFILMVGSGFLLGNHFSFQGEKGFNWEGAKTFNIYMKKKILCSKTCKSIRFKFKKY